MNGRGGEKSLILLNGGVVIRREAELQIQISIGFEVVHNRFGKKETGDFSENAHFSACLTKVAQKPQRQ